MRSFKVRIQGITPYMQHKMNDAALKESEVSAKKTIGRTEVDDDDTLRANAVVYRDKANGKCYIPNAHIKGALIGAGSYVKAKVGTRSKSLKTVAAAMFFVAPEKIYLPEFDEVDIRSAVNQKVKARIIVMRPKWNEWEATFELRVDEDAIKIDDIRAVLTYAGNYVGIGSFRPTNNGEFGRFEIIDFVEIDAKK